MKHTKSIAFVAVLVSALAGCDSSSSTPEMEVAAAELAEAKGIENYTIEVVENPDGVPQSPSRRVADDAAVEDAGPGVGGFASEQPDPLEARIQCTDYSEAGETCTVCVLHNGGCLFITNSCTGTAADVCSH